MRLSIVVPVWNRQKEIARCLDSIKAVFEKQIEEGIIELIVTDNSSEDDTVATVKEWMERNHIRVSLLQSESNVGPMNNWLRGLNNARGEYALLLFSDDYIVGESDFDPINVLNDMRAHGIAVGRLGILMEDQKGNCTTDAYLNLRFKRNETTAATEFTKDFIDNHFARSTRSKLKRDFSFSPVSPTGYIINRSMMISAIEKWGDKSDFSKNGAGIDQLMILFPALHSEKVARVSGLAATMVASDSSITRLSQEDAVKGLELSISYSYSGILLIPELLKMGGKGCFNTVFIIVFRYLYQRCKLFFIGLV